MKNSDHLTLFDKWNKALQSGNPKEVTALYARDAILLPTLSRQVHDHHEMINDYFVSFLKLGPIGNLDESHPKRIGNILLNNGLYTFRFKDGTSVQARFSFVYEWDGKDWLIIRHHSSVLPGYTDS